MRLASKLSRTLALNWTPNRDCGCKFSDLFDNRIFEVGNGELKALQNRPRLFDSDQWYVVDTWKLLALPDDLPENFGKAYESKTGKTIDHEFDRIPLALRKEYLTYLTTLMPAEFIRNQVGEFAKQFDEKTLSVSIRSWSEDKQLSAALFSLESVYRDLDAEEDATFFVCCDSEEVLEKIRQRYRARVITYPHRVKAGDRLTKIGMQEGLIDLLLLSRNSRLKASPYSTFSEMAWWFGGCKASVEMIGNGMTGQNPFGDRMEEFNRLLPADLLDRAAKFAAKSSAGT
jgi:hypothetical protein